MNTPWKLFALLIAGSSAAAIGQQVTGTATATGTATPTPIPTFEGPPVRDCPSTFAFQVSLASETGPTDEGRGGNVVVWKVEKTGNVTKVDLLTAAGKRGEYWISPGGAALQPPGDRKFVGEPHAYPEYCVQFGKYGFPETGWVARNHFVQIMSHKGHPALYFRTQMVIDEQDVELQAWIDYESRLPLATAANEKVFVYQYLPPPTEQLRPPHGAEEAKRAEQKRMKRLLGTMSGP